MTWLPRYYGWRIAAAAFGIQMLGAAVLMQAYGAYVAVLSQELGWSKTALAAGAAIQSLEGALIGPVLGWMIDRVGPRVVAQVGVVLFAAGLAAFSAISSLAGFYGALMVIALGNSMCGYFPLSVCLVHFFRRQRTRALSLMSLGLAAGGLALPVIGWAMQTYGWRTTALGSAVVVLVAGLPLAGVLRRNPAEVGQQVDGDEPALGQPVDGASGPAGPPVNDEGGRAVQTGAEGESPQTAPVSAAPEREFTAAEALRTRAFWLLGIAHGMALLVVTAVNVHALSHMTQGLGYSLAQASFFITLMTVGQGAGVLLGAAAGDGWDKRRAAAACMLAHGAGLLALTFASHPVLLIAFAVLHGVAWGLRGPFMQAIRADYFGLKAIGTILGLSAAIIAVGQVAGPMVAGMLADATGSYRAGFVLLALVSASGSVMFLMARKPE